MWGFSKFIQICEAPAGVGTGLYASRDLEPTSAEALLMWMRDNKIPNPTPVENMHVTVVHTKTDLPDWKPDLKPVRIKPSTYSIAKFDGKLGNVLVLRFRSPELSSQNQKARAMGAVMTYPTYAPHVTLSYKVPPDFDWQSLRPPPIYLELEPEHVEAVDDSFVASLKLGEVAPPGKKIERWLADPVVRNSFKREYGDKWQEVMYGTAWRKYQATV